MFSGIITLYAYASKTSWIKFEIQQLDSDGEIENSEKTTWEKAGYKNSVTFKLKFLTLAIYQWQRLGLSNSATMKKCEK